MLYFQHQIRTDAHIAGIGRNLLRLYRRQPVGAAAVPIGKSLLVRHVIDRGTQIFELRIEFIFQAVQPLTHVVIELFEQFLQLLFEHCKEQHVVTFYAEKLFITPQYLSLILKELTGKSANKWIDDALIVEAKMLLKAPQATVQQVADILHFSDQSTFGKFFKKHMGISPMEYRKS